MLLQKYDLDEKMGAGFALGALADSGIYGLELFRKNRTITERERKLLKKGLDLITRVQEGRAIEPRNLTFKKLYCYKSAKLLEYSNNRFSQVIGNEKLEEVKGTINDVLNGNDVTGERIEKAQIYLDFISEQYFRTSFHILHEIKEKYDKRSFDKAIQE